MWETAENPPVQLRYDEVAAAPGVYRFMRKADALLPLADPDREVYLRLVPAGHSLRLLLDLVDFGPFRDELHACCSDDQGRPPHDPPPWPCSAWGSCPATTGYPTARSCAGPRPTSPFASSSAWA